MQARAMKNFLTVVIAMLLTAVVARAYESGEEPAANGEETKTAEEKQQEKESMDIAAFYAAHTLVWIFGFGASHYPCMLDAIHSTSESSTTFTRYHKDGISFQGRDLVGRFFKKNSREAKYNAMTVSPDRVNSRHKQTKSWSSEEVMLSESTDKNCSLFQVKYFESPNDRFTRGTSRKEPTVEYNLRVKNSFLKMPEVEMKDVETCFEGLKRWYDSQQQPNKQELEFPKTITECKEACQRHWLCGSARTAQKMEGPSETT
uniref:Lipocalin n=1 Tax=Rhipicephalus appendiculatus TaxID=34631 RepID=A0A131Z5E0_RHIAP